MNYFTEYWYVWIIFAIMCVFLFSFYGKKFKQVKEKRKQYEEKLAQEKDMFSHLTSDVFDKIEPIDLTRAVIFHINAKEDRLYEDDNYDGTYSVSDHQTDIEIDGAKVSATSGSVTIASRDTDALISFDLSFEVDNKTFTLKAENVLGVR